MGNNIQLAEKFLPLLDKKYQKESVTAILDAPPELVRATEQANEIRIPKMLMQGLADYDRNAGYTEGDINLSWETHTFTQDRGRTFSVDEQDNMETVEVAFGSLAGTFISDYVVPEIDAYRLNTYYNHAGTSVTGVLTEDDVVQLLMKVH